MPQRHILYRFSPKSLESLPSPKDIEVKYGVSLTSDFDRPRRRYARPLGGRFFLSFSNTLEASRRSSRLMAGGWLRLLPIHGKLQPAHLAATPPRAWGDEAGDENAAIHSHAHIHTVNESADVSAVVAGHAIDCGRPGLFRLAGCGVGV